MLSLIALIVVCLTYVSLAFLVISNNPRMWLNRVSGALMLTTSLWSIVVYLEDVSGARGSIEQLVRLDYVLAACMVGLFYWFCALLAPRRFAQLDGIVGGLTAVTVVFAALGLMAEVTMENDHVILEPNGYFPLFVLLLVLGVGGGFARLFWKFSVSKAREKAQITFVALGLLLTIVALLAAVVVAPRLFGAASADMTRFGIYSTLFFAGFSTYAVIRHRFMDIRRLVVRSIVYASLLFTLASMYVVSVFQVGDLIFDGESNDTIRRVYDLFLALLLAFTFQPLRRFFERLTNRIFYREHYDPQQVLTAFSRLLASELDLDRLLKRSITKLCRDLHIEFGQTVVLREGEVYREGHYGKLSAKLRNGAVPTFNKSLLVAAEIEGSEDAHVMEQFGLQAFLQLRTQDGTVGYLMLGGKLSGSVYSSQDIRLLTIIARELAVAVLNARSYAEIQSFNETLQRRVNDATSKLRETNKKLRALDEAKDEFISMASHQMRTPLTSVKGYISMILEGYGGSLKPEQRRLLSEAYNSSQRMVYLIADFLSVSRIRTDKFTLESKPVNLTEVIQDEINQLEVTAQNRGLTLVYHEPTHFPTLMLDEEKIRQVIMNLIDNAIYYTEPGGTVTVILSATAKEVSFKVQDTGIGVPKAQQHKLFGKFFRASNALKMRPDGTGIGLFLAKKIVALQGGAVIFESKEGKGSTFGFSFPRARLEPKES